MLTCLEINRKESRSGTTMMTHLAIMIPFVNNYNSGAQKSLESRGNK